MSENHIYAIYTSPEGTHPTVSLVSNGANRISIQTEIPLTDEQKRGLYFLISAMCRTGKTLKELMQENIKA